MDRLKVMVLGANGMLGSALSRVVARKYETIALGHADADITVMDSIMRVIGRFKPSVVFNCAAYTNVDQAENEKETAMMINGHGPKNVARACEEQGCFLVHIGSDYVFDGKLKRPYREDDEPCPISAYGESKLLGDVLVQKYSSRFVIARTQALYGPMDRSSFVTKLLARAKTNAELKVVDDQVTAPTYVPHLAVALAGLLDHLDRIAGNIVNIAGSKACSWYDFSVNILSCAGLDTKITPISTDQINSLAQRPKYSVLDCLRFEKITGTRVPGYEDGLKDLFNQAS